MIRQTSKQTIHGARLWRLVADADLKPADLARLAGVSDQLVYGWLKRGVSSKSAAKVGMILGCDPGYISNTSRKQGAEEKRFNKTTFKSVPIVDWQDIQKMPIALAASDQFAAFVIKTDLNTMCYALRSDLAPGLYCSHGFGVSAVILVDPGLTDLTPSKFGYVVQGPSDPLPLFRQIDISGADHYLIGVDPRYPTPPTPYTREHKIWGTVIAVGIASEPLSSP